MKISSGVTAFSVIFALSAGGAWATETPQGLEDVAAQCLGTAAGGGPVTNLNLATFVVSPFEVFQTGLSCSRLKYGNVDRLAMGSTLTQSIVNGDASTRVDFAPYAFVVQDGPLKGSLNERIDSSDVDGTQIDAADIVSKGTDGSVVVKRQYREIEVVTELQDGNAQGEAANSRVVERLILELNGQGQPVLRTDHFDGTVDPQTLASAIGGNASDYASGISIVQSVQASLNSCILAAQAGDAASCISGQNNQRKLAMGVGAQFMPGFITSLGWQQDRIPTNNRASWTSNRVDFTKNLNELISRGASLSAGSIAADTLAAWIKDAKEAINDAAAN